MDDIDKIKELLETHEQANFELALNMVMGLDIPMFLDGCQAVRVYVSILCYECGIAVEDAIKESNDMPTGADSRMSVADLWKHVLDATNLFVDIMKRHMTVSVFCQETIEKLIKGIAFVELMPDQVKGKHLAKILLETLIVVPSFMLSEELGAEIDKFVQPRMRALGIVKSKPYA